MQSIPLAAQPNKKYETRFSFATYCTRIQGYLSRSLAARHDLTPLPPFPFPFHFHSYPPIRWSKSTPYPRYETTKHPSQTPLSPSAPRGWMLEMLTVRNIVRSYITSRYVTSHTTPSRLSPLHSISGRPTPLPICLFQLPTSRDLFR